MNIYRPGPPSPQPSQPRPSLMTAAVTLPSLLVVPVTRIETDVPSAPATVNVLPLIAVSDPDAKPRP